MKQERRALKIGYLLDTHGAPYDSPSSPQQAMQFIEHLYLEAQAAERSGFDAVFVPERHGRSECMFPSPFLLMAAVAARTANIRIGSFVTILPLYHPMQVAEQAAMLDLMTKGRFVLGLGSGYHPGYNAMFGVPMKERRRRFEEGLAIIKAAWTQDVFSYQGEIFRLEKISLWPKPYSSPGPTLWIGGMFPYTIRRAGREGDAWACGSTWPLEEETWKRQVDWYTQAAISSGKKPYIVLIRDGWVAPTREEALTVLGPVALEEILFYFRWGIFTTHPDFRSESDFTIERIAEHLVIGSPSDCVAQIKRYEEDYGVDYLVMRFRMPNGPERPRVLECIQRFGEEVIPLVSS